MKPIYTYNCEIIVCYFLCKNFYFFFSIKCLFYVLPMELLLPKECVVFQAEEQEYILQNTPKTKKNEQQEVYCKKSGFL